MTTYQQQDTLALAVHDAVDRQALRELHDCDDDIAFETLVRRVRHGRAVHVDADHVRMRLYHVLLPRLAAAELIAWNRAHAQVTFTGNGRVEHMLNSLDDMA